MRAAADIRAAFHDAVADRRWADTAEILAAAGGSAPTIAAEIDDRTALHAIRQAYGRLPDPQFAANRPRSRRVRRIVTALRRDGMIGVGRGVPRRLLHTVRRQLDASIAVLDRAEFERYDQHHYWRGDQQALVFNDGLAMAPALTALCRHPLLVGAANHYLGRVAHIKRVYGMRYLPLEQPTTHQFGWHHDMEDRMLKVMVLLTDVTETDQFMSYVTGTQDSFHPLRCFERNPLSFDQLDLDPATAPTVHTIGRAGDLFLFDPNGMHRGQRSLGAARDAVFIEYTADGNRGNVWGSQLGVDQPGMFGSDPEDPLRHFRGLEPKWERAKLRPRTTTTWLESLDDPACWLRTDVS